MTIKGLLKDRVYLARSRILSLPFLNPLFTEIEIETIRACTRRCEYCPVTTVGGAQGKMKEEIFYKVIDSLKRIDFKGRISPHLYGEPLLDPRIVFFVKYIRSNLPKANIKITTNGDLLTEEKYLKLMRAGVSSFTISQHTEKLLPKLAKTLSHIRERHKELYKVRIYNFYDIYYNNHNPGKVLFNNRAGTTKVKAPRQTYCSQVNQANVDFMGNVVLCSNDYSAEVNFGNVGNEDVVDIWFKKEYLEARRRINAGDWAYTICQRCKNT